MYASKRGKSVRMSHSRNLQTHESNSLYFIAS